MKKRKISGLSCGLSLLCLSVCFFLFAYGQRDRGAEERGEEEGEERERRETESQDKVPTF